MAIRKKKVISSPVVLELVLIICYFALKNQVTESNRWSKCESVLTRFCLFAYSIKGNALCCSICGENHRILSQE